jgi:hypothetical protein
MPGLIIATVEAFELLHGLIFAGTALPVLAITFYLLLKDPRK